MKGAGGGSPAAGDQIWIDGVQIEQGSFATPYVETNGAPATRAAGQVLAPSRILTATQAWIALRVRPEWASTADLYGGGDIYLFDWFGTDFLRLFYNPPNDLWIAQRRGSAGLSNATKAGTHASGATLTLIFAWDAAQHRLSLNGSAFTASANAQTPSGLPSQFSLGAGQDGADPLDGELLWALAGVGPLFDSDAATIHGYGDNDPDPASAPGQATFLWTAVDDEWVEQAPVRMVYSSDSGSGSDTAALATSLSAADTGAGADSSQLAAAIPATDAGAGSDSSQQTASLAGSDNGAGADASALRASLSASDAGAGIDTAIPTALFSVSDAGSGADFASLLALLSSSEVGSGSETAALAAVLAATDTGSGTETATIRFIIAVADAGTGTDSALLNAFLTPSDTGTGSEQSSLTALVPSTDAGAGSESSQLLAVIADADLGAGLDSATLSAVLADLDSGSGADSEQLNVLVLDGDTGIGLDSEDVSHLILVMDAGTGDDSASVTVSVSDSDSGQGADGALLGVQVRSADHGTAIETWYRTPVQIIGTSKAGRIVAVGRGELVSPAAGSVRRAGSTGTTRSKSTTGRIVGPGRGEVRRESL